MFSQLRNFDFVGVNKTCTRDGQGYNTPPRSCPVDYGMPVCRKMWIPGLHDIFRQTDEEFEAHDMSYRYYSY